VTIVIKYWY